MQPRDTIVALATPAEAGGRAIVRVSGPGAVAATRAVFRPVEVSWQPNRLVEGEVYLPDVVSPLPATLYFWRGPRSYTGDDVVELHTIGCVPLVEALVAALLAAGCRAAGPGEFTQRAFLAGKLDLTRAEAVQAVIEASDRAELKQALAQMAGGLARPLGDLREEMLNLLADVEAALDFADEAIETISQRDLLLGLTRALAQVTLLGKQVTQRSLASGAFRVVLAGRPNAGKSSLFNALTGATALVADAPGTTRDYLAATLKIGDAAIELVDTPGATAVATDIESAAQRQGAGQRATADLLLMCVQGEANEEEEASIRAGAVRVQTKADLGAGEGLATSAVSGEGLATSASAAKGWSAAVADRASDGANATVVSAES